MIQVSINIAESDRQDSNNTLSCQIYNSSDGSHLFGFKWDGGQVDSTTVNSPSVSVDPFPDVISEVEVVVQTTTQFDYEIVVDYL